MSINIKIRDAVKKYGDTTIIPGLSLDIQPGEFFTMLGPSGCGKTTMLRMIAGFNTIEGGDFYFNETRINDMEPSKRRIGMVFQNYAIFPHLSVRKNVEFGLRNMKFPKDQIREKAEEYIKLVQIDRWADQMPDRLSGGQQQRVALARALVTNPDVLLMDEPLSNLDAKLRIEMRDVIRQIQREVGTTTVYVTHDQEEAMAVSDRIAVMKDGIIQQLGTPPELYHRPSNLFVATFIGRSNVLPAELVFRDGEAIVSVAGGQFVVPGIVDEPGVAGAVQVSVRPEQFVLDRTATTGIPATVDHSIFLGLNTHHVLNLNDGTTVEVIEESEIEGLLEPGTQVFLDLKVRKINVYTADGERNLLGWPGKAQRAVSEGAEAVAS
ncbi:polyamine ABC transporter ATP-binding protein [Tessaracoccus aquimaris]|uniref:Polyamine ABC transporter ATP-binding protein n=1 Tax=Tessaracoccus aquimaris TaxID=1332264 RepID=A0A1Q2CQG6_9ACTN|nr:ABC transporter ATP-binding protein [Tessaracoccus aquimaris]AQP48356.1 polyamine ABC transporter ATP-binding protein [Tessaracoccus aquimaris]